MKSFMHVPWVLLALFGAANAQVQSAPVDSGKARGLIERQGKGGTLTDEERSHVERATAERLKPQAGQASADGIDWQKAQELYRRERRGEELTADETAYLQRAKEERRRTGRGGEKANAEKQRKAPESMKPLCDMSAVDRYEGEDGGLYGGGHNTPPETLRKAAEAALCRIEPIDGKIVLVSISMSNATMEFSTFKRMADSDARKSEHLTVVDCA